MRKKSTLVGIAGGSGSGKTTLARKLHAEFGSLQSVILQQDHYYLDQSKTFDGDSGNVNFDHPNSLEFSLLAKQLGDLREGKDVEVPMYDFTTHSRIPKTDCMTALPLILLDGTLIMSQPEVVKHLDLKVFVAADEKIRFERRLARDVRERGRTPEGVHKQFYSQVKPMHDLFVEPSREQADIIVFENGFDEGYELIRQFCLKRLNS